MDYVNDNTYEGAKSKIIKYNPDKIQDKKIVKRDKTDFDIDIDDVDIDDQEIAEIREMLGNNGTHNKTSKQKKNKDKPVRIVANTKSDTKQKPKRPDLTCANCGREFPRKRNLDYHVKNNACKTNLFFCKNCGKGFTHETNMYRHMRDACKDKNDKIDNEEIVNRLKKIEDINEKLIGLVLKKKVSNSKKIVKDG